MRIGIIGLPNSGKSTIFNVVTGGRAPTTTYAGGTFQINTAVVNVPDARVDALTELSSERVIRQSYDLLGRINFFTDGEDEVRAWEVNREATALECAHTIHGDLSRGFIRAEIVSYEDLVAAGSTAAAKSLGKVRLEGKDHVINDGNMVVIRFDYN